MEFRKTVTVTLYAGQTSLWMGWGGRWEGGQCGDTHVHPWLIYVNVWQNPPQCCEVISLQFLYIYK